ncbi:pirin family protein [Paenibacillus puerhi]|uniref:pirin family protein n=1 Tax=Paenibacillus puerhi TaxID=2692622 RepID=UPI00135C9686|nr:pirin family protein [Paenibacillus puerhi]
MQIMVYPPSMQGEGSFNGGKITEQKPIGFSGEGSVVKRIGPLFYWAWAFSEQEGHIGLHPHQAFEIMTYVVQGKAEHGDTLGTRSVVGPGGVQIMQTGSGVSHEEHFIGPNMEAFQIWFEPELKAALQRTPTYRQFEHEQFPIMEGDGYTLKTVIGPGAPVELVADARVWDLEAEPGSSFSYTIPAGRSLAVLAIRGHGAWIQQTGDHQSAETAFHQRDFMTLRADAESSLTLRPEEGGKLRLIGIEVPTTVPYSQYPKR